MMINRVGFVKTNPLRRSPPWDYRSKYFIVNAAVTILWLLRIISPAAWFASAFSDRDRDDKDERYYSQPLAMEIYLIGVLALGFLAAFWPLPDTWRGSVVAISVILIVEIVQYHIFLMLFWPYIDPKYTQYSPVRTIILTFMAYINLVNLFAAIYFYGLREQFQSEINRSSAWAFSAGEITGAGYAGIDPQDTFALAITSGIEKLVGIIFLALVISLALGRIGRPEIDDDLDKLRAGPSTQPPTG